MNFKLLLFAISKRVLFLALTLFAINQGLYSQCNISVISGGTTTIVSPATIYDPAGTANYTNNLNNVKTYTAPAGFRLTINFTAFNTESGFDFMTLYEGTAASGTPLLTWSGTALPSPTSYTSTGQSLTIKFTSDASVVNIGYVATLTCLASCSNTTSGGTISSNQTLCGGYDPALISSSAVATGGSGGNTYQWESSLNNSTWTDISGATATTYDPPAITQTTYYRRKSKSSSCSVWGATSNTVTKAVAAAITLGTPTVSAVIDQPLTDIVTVDVVVSWTTVAVGQKINVTYNNRTKYIDVPGGAVSPQTIRFMAYANGTTGNTITATWDATSGCTSSTTFTTPSPISNPQIACNILYLCGDDKPYDAYPFDHGLIDYLDVVSSGTVTPVFLKNETGFGFYDPNNPTLPLTINLNNYNLIIISPSTEGRVSADLKKALVGLKASILNMNYEATDELGMTASASYAAWGTDFATSTTLVEQILDYGNVNPLAGYLMTVGDYKSYATSGGLWTNTGAAAAGNGSAFYRYNPHSIAEISSTHGTRVFFGLHMNGLYGNAQNGAALPVPPSFDFVPTNHLTQKGKLFLDNAILAAATCTAEICDNGTDDDGDGFVDCVDPDCNYVPNNEFDNGTTNWNLYVQSGNAATLSVDGGQQLRGLNSAKIVTTTTTGTEWHVQLAETGNSIVAGKSYTVSFVAKASAARNASIALQLGSTPFTSYFYNTFALTTTGQEYSFEFTASASVTNNITLLFNLASVLGTVWIDDVEFKESCSNMCGVECVSSNLLTNGSFTTDFSSWTASNGQLSVGTGGPFGNFVVVNNSDLAGSYTIYQDVTIGANKPFLFRGLAAKHGTTPNAKVYLEFYNGTTYLSKTADFNVLRNYDGIFQIITPITGYTPANTTKIRVVGWCNGTAIKLDELSLVTCDPRPTITATTPASRCGTGTVTLGATASAGTINWYAAATGGTSLGTGTSFTTPSLSATTTYYVDASNGTCIASARTAVIATITTTPTISGTTPGSRCGTGTVTLGATASAGTINWYAAATGGTSLGTGTSFTTPSIAATTTYYVDATSGACISARTAVVATVNAIPTITATTPASRCGTGTLVLGATASAGTINWYAAATGGASLGTGTSFTTPSLSATTTYYVDATSGTCVTATRTAVVATVNTIPTITATTPASRCGAGTVVLGATASAGTINWYAAATGGTSLGTGASFTTPSLSATTTYYVDATSGTCVTASRTAVIATVNAAAPTITATTPASICGTGTATLGATASAGTINWYAAATGGASLGTGTSFTTPSISATTIYYVDATSGTCTTATRTAVTATVNTIPTITATTPASRCGTGTVVLGATASAGTINWYAAATGGASLGTGTSFTTPSISATTIYYVDATSGTCTTASRTAVTATVNTIPTISGTTPATICGTGTATLGATASAGTINWYAAATGGASLGTGTSFTTPSISATTTYYVDATSGTCTTASRTAVIATVNASAPTITGSTPGSICGSGTVTLGATSSGGTINWYAASTGGASLGTGISFTTPSISTTTTYYVDATSGTCTTASRTAIIATVNASAPTITGTTPANRCGTGTVTLSAAASGGTINWYAAATGGTSLGTGISYTTPSISASTTYYVDATSGTCTTPSRTAIVATINAKPTTNITGSNTSLCIGGTTTVSPTTLGTWTSSNTAVATITNGGLITAVSAGTATFTYTLTSTSCASDVTAPFTVNAKPTVTISGASTICAGSTTSLSPTTGGTWASSNTAVATVTNAGVVTGVAAGTATFVFTSSSTLCPSDATSAVTVNAKPTISITGASTLCIGATTTLSPTTGGTWASGNTAVATVTNAGLVTSVGAGSTTFTFTQTSTGCLSNPSTDITINALPSISITKTLLTCGGMTLTATGGGTYLWSTGETTASISPFPIFTTTYSVTVTNAAGCTASSSLTTASNPGLSATACLDFPAGRAPCFGIIELCEDKLAGLRGKAYGNGPFTFMWDNGVGAGADHDLSLSADGLPTKNYIYTLTVTDVNGCTATSSATVMVHALPVATISGNNTLCIGESTTLTASSATSYLWSNGATTSSITVSPAATTTYTVTVTNGFGCTSTSTRTVTVTSAPSIISTTPGNTCVSGTVILGATASLGTINWYAASTGGSSLGTGSTFTTPVISSTTTYYVDASVGTCITASRTAVIATVDSRPTTNITGGNTSLCIGGTTAISPTTLGTWTSSNTAVATITNAGLITAVSAGTATFTYTLTSTGCTSLATAPFTVNAKPSVSITGGTSLCIGSTSTLSPNSGGTWTSSNTAVATVTNAGLVTGVSVGTATFTFTQTSTGCPSDATSVITVGAKPSTNITGANTSLCIGGTTTISPTTGGTWSSSNTAVATITNAGLITAVSAGTATFTYTLSGGGCTSDATAPFTVNAKPTVSITGGTSLCIGGTTTLSPTTGGTWASSNTAVATVTNGGLVTGIAAGTATFTFTSSTTLCPSDATSAVTVNAKPIALVSGTRNICIGGTTTLSPSTGGTWTSSNTSVASVTNSGLVTGINGGSATFTFTSGSTGCVSDASLSVNVSPSMTANINYNGSVCLTTGSTLTAIATGGTSPYTYNWTGPSSYTSTSQNASIALNGNYALTITDAYGCPANTTGFVYAKYEPLIVSLSTTICEGDNVNLTLNAPNAVSYLWSSNAGSSTSSTVTVTPSLPSSTYIVTVTNNQGCIGSASATINVTAKPVVSISGGGTICQGQTTTLSPSTGGTWTSNNPVVATVTNGGVVTGISAGTASFTYMSSATNCISNPTPNVTVLAKPVVSILGPNAICKLSTTQLSPSTGGTWTSSNTAVATVTNSGLVTGVAAGTATFTFTSSNGCVSNATGTVTVDNNTGVVITGSNSICIGSTSILSASQGGGTWSSNNTAVATIDASGLVTGISAGNATIKYASNSGACQNESTYAITVNPVPTVSITGSNIICGQTTTQLSPSTGGTWTSSNTAVATVSNAGLVTGVSAGTATFVFTSTAGCASSPTASITVNGKPVVSYTGPTTICINSNTQLNPSTGGTWSSSNNGVATINSSGTVVGIGAGTATFTFTSTSGCVSNASAPVTVTTKPSLVIDYNGSVCLTGDSKLSVNTTGGTPAYSYAWTGPSGFTGNTQLINITANGNYGVTVTDINGCSANASGFVYEKFDPFVVSLQTKVCEGSTTTINANTSSAVSYLWSSNTGNATTASVTVTPTVPSSTYYVTITNTIGCTAVANAVIVVDPKPVVTITGGATICQGATTTLTPSTGGTWVSNNPSVATVTNGGVVTGIAPGTATFVYTNATTGCASNDSPVVTISDKPVVSYNGPTTICINGTTNLVPSTGGTWTSNNTSVATITNGGVVTAVAAGSTTFTYVSSLSSCTSASSAPLTVTGRPTVSITGDATICVGLTSTLSPSTGGTWTSSNPSVATVTNSGVVTGVSAGTATFTFTNTIGCSSNPTAAITINARPTVTYTGPTAVCVGGTSSITPNTNGLWTSSNTSIATISNTGLIASISPGTVTFSYTNGSTTCVSDPSAPFTVNAKPTVSIVGPSSLCIGSTTSLSPSTGGTWTSNSPSIATINNSGIVTAIAPGTASFYFTNTATGCVSNNTASILVYTKPTVSITGANSICIGSTSTMSPSTGGTWTSSNTSVATITNSGIVTGVAQGTATFTYTETSSGCISNPSLPITVGPRPTVTVSGPTSICIGGASTLSPSTGGTWVSNNPAIATVTNSGIVTGVSQGSVTFTYTTSAGCASNPTSAIMVNGKPTLVFIGPKDICIGSTTSISPTSGGTWVSNNSSIATISASGTITGISNGTATFTFTDQTTGCVSDPSATMTVNEKPVINNIGTPEICIGNTTQLVPTTGGVWTSSDANIASVSSNGQVTGVAEGTASFTYTNSATGCSSTQALSVKVNGKPIITLSGPSSICIGTTTQFSPSTGGIWVSKNPTIASISSTGEVTGLSQGIARFTYTSSTTGCVSNNSSPVVVNGKPSTSVSGPNQICIGAITQLSPSIGGTWVSENPSVATVNNNGVVTGMASGTATFVFTESASGCSSSSGLNGVTVSSPGIPSIIGQSVICLGYQTQLAAPITNVIWSSSNSKIATVSNDGVVTGIAPGKVTFTYTSIATGCSASLPADAISVKNCVDPDFNVTLANVQLNGDVSTNDEVPSGTTWGQPMLMSKPTGSTVSFVVNADGKYTFTANVKGQYTYYIPVCVPPMIYACPTTQIVITVIDPLDSGNKNISNIDIATVYAGDSISINALSNDKCLNNATCALDVNTMTMMNAPIKGSTHMVNSDGFMYTPHNGMLGLDTIKYKICVDGEPTNCTETKQFIIINAPNALNSTVASDDFFNTYAETPVTGNVLLNDSDPEKNAQAVVSQGTSTAQISIPQGKYYITSTGALNFTPLTGFSGPVDIVYTVCDNHISSPQCVKATAHILVLGDMSVNLRVYLEGALMQNGDITTSDGKPMMRDDLRVNPFDGNNYIPVRDPYKFGTEFVSINNNYEYVATGTMARYADPLDSLTVFSVTGRDAIVDWVFVELRSKADNKIIVASRSALLQRDGDIVDVDGVSGLKFAQISLDSFYVVVRHRNHLGVMSKLVANGQLVDFTLPTTEVFDFGTSLNNGMDYTGLALNPNIKNGYRALWAGDFDANRKLKFTNPSDDQNTLFFDVFSHADNTVGNANYNYTIGYYQGDYNMNGKSKYDNPNDDKNLLFSQILLYPLNTQYLSNFDFFIEQIP